MENGVKVPSETREVLMGLLKAGQDAVGGTGVEAERSKWQQCGEQDGRHSAQSVKGEKRWWRTRVLRNSETEKQEVTGRRYRDGFIAEDWQRQGRSGCEAGHGLTARVADSS